LRQKAITIYNHTDSGTLALHNSNYEKLQQPNALVLQIHLQIDKFRIKSFTMIFFTGGTIMSITAIYHNHVKDETTKDETSTAEKPNNHNIHQYHWSLCCYFTCSPVTKQLILI